MKINLLTLLFINRKSALVCELAKLMNIALSFSFDRLLWMFVVLAALFWASYSIFGSILRYKQYESATKVSIQHVDSIKFPTVTFCNLNQWRRSSLRDEIIRMISTAYSLNQTHRDEFDWSAYREAINATARSWSVNFTALALDPQRGAYSLREMLLECYWNGVEVCNEFDFATIITDLGVCYTFNNPSNPADVKVVNKPGTDTGLTLTLNIGHYDYIQGEYQGAGIKVGPK